MTAAITRSTVAAIAATALALPYATEKVTKWEGFEGRTYSDIVGKATYCWGETRGAVPGKTYTPGFCRDALAVRLMEFGIKIYDCLPPDLHPFTRGAFISTSYNIGIAAFCGSSMSRRALAGDLRGACKALDMWNKAGKVVVLGLTLRRSDERALCEAGINGAGG